MTFCTWYKFIHLFLTDRCFIPRKQFSSVCLVIKNLSKIKSSQIKEARLTTFVPEWIDSKQIYLSIHYVRSESNHRFYERNNSTILFARRVVNQKEVTWDVTDLIRDMIKLNRSVPHEIGLFVECIEQFCGYNDPFSKSDVLRPNSLATLVVDTLTTMRLKKRLFKRRVNERSFDEEQRDEQLQTCPSFLHIHRNQTRCCLFKYTLTTEQIEHNDGLRFILLPKNLPLNLCHGRCIGKFRDLFQAAWLSLLC